MRIVSCINILFNLVVLYSPKMTSEIFLYFLLLLFFALSGRFKLIELLH